MVARTTISIKDGQKKVFDRMRADYALRVGRGIPSIHEMFGIMIEYYNSHISCIEKDSVDRLLRKDGNE